MLYKRLPRMFAELELGRADGRYPRLFRALTKANLLILDDWGPERLNPDQRRDLMEIVEDRCQNAATLITSQLPAGQMARGHRRTHLRRRHPRPHRPQCPQAGARRTLPCERSRPAKTAPPPLTRHKENDINRSPNATITPGQTGPLKKWPLWIGMGGRFSSESMAVFIGMRTKEHFRLLIDWSILQAKQHIFIDLDYDDIPHSGFVVLMNRLDFNYKRPKGLPARADEAKQAAFIEGYEKLLRGLHH